ncbi:hypothetical protein [Leeuwenhoekiella marinoflava]|uniref:hypothetical protein n=1 Tax=Leeuwenhoekiella marinoflava TaxID=988 RepID=UPI00300181D0
MEIVIDNTDLEISYLINIAETYYPKYISAYSRQEYANTPEIKSLKRNIKKNLELLEFFKNDLDKDFPEHLIHDISIPSWFDRCVSFSFEEKSQKETHTKSVVILAISLLIPYYVIYQIECTKLTDNRVSYKLITNNSNREIVKKIKSVVEEKLAFKYLNPKYHDRILKNISFEDIPEGKFTLFNAFFKNEKDYH